MKTVRYRAAGGVVVRDDQVLLLDRPRRGEVRLPKGHIEDDESPRVAALRETQEETGYADLAIVADLGSTVVAFDYDGKHIVRDEYYYVMRLQSSATVARPAQDEAQFVVRWTPLSQALDLLTFDAERDVVRRTQLFLDGEAAASAAH